MDSNQQAEQAEIRRHNERIARSNPKPEPLPAAADDIAQVIAEYNAAEQLQLERLGAIYMYCIEHRKRAVNFSSDRWSNFPYDSQRQDIGLSRYCNPLVVFINSIE